MTRKSKDKTVKADAASETRSAREGAKPKTKAAPKRKPAKPRRSGGRAQRKSVQPRRRNGALRRVLRRLPWRSLTLVASVTALIVGANWLWKSGHVQATADSMVEGLYAATADLGFAVTSIQVVGRGQSGEQEILEALETERGAAILRFDPEEARRRVEALPWIEEARVERRLPGQIRVTISEKSPVALWQSSGEWSVIDAEGRVIEGAAPGAFSQLPKLVGEGAERHVAEILALIDLQPDLSNQVYAAIRVGDRRWNLRLHSGIDVRLPENDLLAAWERLARLESVADLLSRDVTVIDLRRADRLLLRLAPDAEIRQPVEGQET